MKKYILLAMIVSSVASAMQYYSILEIGTVYNGRDSVALGMNEKGEVVGSCNLIPNSMGYADMHAFVYSKGSVRDIGTLGGKMSVAHGINIHGEIAGTSYTSDGSMRAFLYKDGVMKNLGTLPKSAYSYATGINDKGQVIGFANTDGHDHTFLYENGVMKDLGAFGGSHSYGYGMNNKGEITGSIAGLGHAFIYSNGVAQDIGKNLPYGYISEGKAISDNGYVVGGVWFKDQNKPFIYKDGSMKLLDNLNGKQVHGMAINNAGDMVGVGNTGAFLYHDGIMQDLNKSIVPLNSKWVLMGAQGINNSGQIVGYGTLSGQGRSFLLTPLKTVNGAMSAVVKQPSEIKYGNLPQKQEGKDNLVLMTHGWQMYPVTPNVSWVDGMSNSISTYLDEHSLNDWQVHGYKWTDNAWKVSPDDALNNAKKEGQLLGNSIVEQGWKHTHLIAHSAGAGLIQSAVETIKKLSPSTTVHCTFLDAYIGLDRAGKSKYGKMADWSDSYFSRDALTSGGEARSLTETALDHAYNVDVTQLDPNKIGITKFRSTTTGEMEACLKTVTSHGWPREFYLKTITGDTTSEYRGFGFSLSKEGGNWNSGISSYACGNMKPMALGTSDIPCTTDIRIVPPTYAVKVIDLVQSPSIFSETGKINKFTNYLNLQTGSPVWFVMMVTNTNPANVVSFDLRFASRAGAQGLLSIYWGTNLVGSIDERMAQSEDPQHYSFRLPEASAGSVQTLGFRLDPFTDIQSSVVLTSIALSRIGPSTPFSLEMVPDRKSGLIMFFLTGERGFDYHIQSSTNLVDWKSTAILENTDGRMRSYGKMTDTSMKFYRAVVEY